MSRNVLAIVPDQELTVGIKRKDMAFFRLVEPGAKEALSTADLEALTQLKGVRKVVPLTYGNQPSSARIDFMGKGLSTEMVVQAFPPEWIADDVPIEKLAWEPGKTVPIVINNRLLSIFNNGYAASQGLPNLSPSALMVPVWDLFYGPADEPPIHLRARIVGLSPKVALGAAMPQKVLDFLHETAGLPAPQMTEAVLYLEGKQNSEGVRQAINQLGFSVDEPEPLARIFIQLKHVGTGAVLTLLTCICLFGFAFLNQTLKMLFLIKAHDYAICRAMGMSRGTLRLILVLEAQMALALDLMLALAAAWLAADLFARTTFSAYLQGLVGMPLELTMPWFFMGLTLLLVNCIGLAVLIPRILVSTARPAGEFLNRT